MTTNTTLITGATMNPSSRMLTPVLIQVPTIRLDRRRRERVVPRRTVRRRLRREVRVAAAALMFAIPMSFILLNWNRPGLDSAISTPSSAAPSMPDAPRAWLSLSSSIAVSPSDAARPPLATPAGYVVPDERAEESFDAGN